MPHGEVKQVQDLIIWQRSFDLAGCAYNLTRGFPKEELYGISSQIRRAAISIPANVAEGFGRYSQKDYARFIGIALGSAIELETLLLLCVKVGITTSDAVALSLSMTKECIRMLRAIRFKLHANQHDATTGG